LGDSRSGSTAERSRGDRSSDFDGSASAATIAFCSEPLAHALFTEGRAVLAASGSALVVCVLSWFALEAFSANPNPIDAASLGGGSLSGNGTALIFCAAFVFGGTRWIARTR
jgi:hypothetical protein